MKLLRHGPVGQKKPGALDADGKARDLSLLVPDFTPEWLTPEKLRALAAIDLNRMPLVPEGARFGPPVTGTRQFVAIGLNYRKHAQEAGLEVPKEPVIFTKALTSLAGPDDDVLLPAGSEARDWEIELGFVIGTIARQVTRERALAHIASYCLANDISERDGQIKRGGTWSKGKSFDGFGPIGPWLVTRDEVPNVQKLGMWLDLNGQRAQTGNTKTMIFSAAKIVSYVSQFMTLVPGDVITTGTPPGVGMGMKPPLFLKKGDVMTLGIEGLGEQRQVVVPFKL